MNLRIGLLAFGLTCNSHAAAAQNSPPTLTSNLMVESCLSQDHQAAGICNAYMLGYLDALKFVTINGAIRGPRGHQLCLPDLLAATEMKDIFIRMVRTVPPLGDSPADAVLWLALEKQFPCPGSSN